MAAGSDQVQSVNRALDILETLESFGGAMGVSRLAELVGLPLPTTHRIARTLVLRGYLRQLGDRRYALGSRLVPLGTAASSRMGDLAAPLLAEIADATGESVNLAALTGGKAEYVMQAPGRHAMRMFTEVGRRVPLHSTGVGKAMLSTFSDDAVRALVGIGPLSRQTSRTIVSVPTLVRDLRAVRERGYAIDDEEMELGVRCVAVAVRTESLLALSVSGPAPRMHDRQMTLTAGVLRRTAARLQAALTG